MEDEPTPDELGFTWTVDDAAEALELTRAQALDLVRLGQLPALVCAPFGPGAPLTVRLRPGAVRAYAARRAGDGLTADETVRPVALEVVRAYLAAHPPTGDYETALREHRPLWASTRRSGRLLHLRVDAVLAAHELSGSPLLLTSSALESALERAGAVLVRGLTPAGDRGGRQRWGWWWRVPASLLSGDDVDGAAADVVRGVVEPGERLTSRGSGRPYLTDALESAR